MSETKFPAIYICDSCAGQNQPLTISAQNEVHFLGDSGEFMDRNYGPEILPDWLKPLYAESVTGWVCDADFNERIRP